MSRSKGHDDGRRRGTTPRDPDGRRDEEQPGPEERSDAKQPEPDGRQAGQRETEQEAQDWAQETGYQPSANQRRHEPMPASQHADDGQEDGRA